MKARIARVVSVLATGTLVVVAGGVARSANINTHAAACQPYAAATAADLQYQQDSLEINNPSPRTVICPVARSPLGTGLTNADFYIDGSNNAGASTTCTIMSTDFNGNILATKSVTMTVVGAYDQLVRFTAAEVPTWAYVSMICTLPGNRMGWVRGVTSIQ